MKEREHAKRTEIKVEHCSFNLPVGFPLCYLYKFCPGETLFSKDATATPTLQ